MITLFSIYPNRNIAGKNQILAVSPTICSLSLLAKEKENFVKVNSWEPGPLHWLVISQKYHECTMQP